ncbi:hypothetical protein TSAR_010768 [Trichomalopsis sarcophagae]|uniref:Checkpoint protein RAD24-like helical bundle domain-containing protein n=1 Tax=Trichomalopsis sarcophagae TaxID=543379 RepID=A0A232FC99_9HYME|nr:hypothetical protein TSAR_010768 [Trichomalopsis sarcophagae]
MSRPKVIMSFLQRNASSWLQSSFDFDDFDDSSTKKKNTSQCLQKSENENLTNFETSISFKRPTSSLSALLAACAPQKASDLAVSRQKQQEINRWFNETVKEGKPTLLLVSGPSGCGKTEALKVIAKENNFDIVEWITPMDQAMDEYNRTMRQGERFEDFLIRATRYGSVLSDSRRLLLVKDIPNSYIDGKDDFSSLLQKYCQYGREPLIFVNTETGNSKLMTTLFSQSNRDRYGIDTININAATPTALKNVMKRVTTILNSKASHMLYVTQSKIDEVLSNTIGDVRSALLNLIFCSLKVKHKFESECTVREETLGLLHGIGRVINPKKNVEGKSWKFVHDPDDLASSFQTHSNTFIKFVHENYMNTMGFNMDGATKAIDVISLADVINSEWRDNNIHKVALSYLIRGVMLANDKPVSQWNPVRKPASWESDVQRNFSVAEVEWYERYINPKSNKQPDAEELSESMIDEVEW